MKDEYVIQKLNSLIEMGFVVSIKKVPYHLSPETYVRAECARDVGDDEGGADYQLHRGVGSTLGVAITDLANQAKA